ncbi:MAG TPA: DUF2339 domain-containing protein [Geminicoccus sp.]|jgi:uncharacterized membrane protein|uniref:DUF2339 domain-containing protein n=1 Tax=Geminicoccus sp. TaxID=2024832 RepID=UPI002E33BEEA|nr:DUF2339 domain-containing protein [Geminicoccus sp.]HEX2526192.1 DUF2339 domain-containing protein [Geminicoccus sp.]
MEIFWLIVVVAGLVMWLRQRDQILRLAARVAALEASALQPVPTATPDLRAVPDGDPALATPSPAPVPESSPIPLTPPGGDLERRLGQRWLVWVGALALALGGVFIVQYSIEQDLIGPIPRVGLGLLVGMLLILAAEFLRKRPDRLRLTPAQTAHAASALAAGGVAALFGASWAAFDLYALIPPGAALGAMALSAGVALLLAWHHGALLAVIALAFGYLAPVLVTTDAPAAPAFATWLIAVQLVLALTLRFRPWTWLLALDLLGLIPLGVILMAGSDAGVALAPLVALAATALPVWLARPSLARLGRPIRRVLAVMVGLEGRTWIGALLMAVTTLAAMDSASASSWPLSLFAILLVAATLLGRAPLHVAFAAAASVVLVAAVLALPWMATPITEVIGEDVIGTPGWRLLAPEHLPFARLCAAMALGFFLVGWLGAMRTPRPGGFAALAVTVPLALLVVAYGRIAGFTAAPRWTVVALVMAALFLLAAERSARRTGREPALAAFALGVVGTLALGLTMALSLGWLTVALSIELVALVLIQRRIHLPALARTAAVLAGIVAGRLLWQAADLGPRDLIETSLGAAIWSYGAPTLLILAAFAGGARLDPPWTRDALAAAGAVAWIVAVMRVVAVGVASDRHDDLLEPSLQVATLTLTTLTLALRPPSRLIRAAVVLSGMMALACLAHPAFRILDGEALRVVDVPVLNPLLLLLAMPAIGLAFMLWRHRISLPLAALRLGAALALLLFLAWPVLEIRRSFAGSVVWGDDPVRLAENWLYSAWLITAGVGLLVVGMVTGLRDLRLAALAVLVLAILKVFLQDLGDLTGLWRAAAFLGLGMTLVGVGLAYQRLFSDDRRATAVVGH